MQSNKSSLVEASEQALQAEECALVSLSETSSTHALLLSTHGGAAFSRAVQRLKDVDPCLVTALEQGLVNDDFSHKSPDWHRARIWIRRLLSQEISRDAQSRLN